MKKNKKKKKHFTNRKLARSMARFQMERAGFRKINRKYGTHTGQKKSPFQIYWRKFALQRGVLG